MRIISYLPVMLALAISDFSNGQDSQGFFADDFKLKKAVIPDYEHMSQPEINPAVNITVNFQDTIAKVLNYIYMVIMQMSI